MRKIFTNGIRLDLKKSKKSSRKEKFWVPQLKFQAIKIKSGFIILSITEPNRTKSQYMYYDIMCELRLSSINIDRNHKLKLIIIYCFNLNML